eukprot:4236683-Pleurochrysis_carterae.AAC.5
MAAEEGTEAACRTSGQAIFSRIYSIMFPARACYKEISARVIKGVGGLSHREYRSFCNERKTAESTGFIDGDLVEAFLSLSDAEKSEVVNGLDVSAEELTRQIEELARLH